MTAPMNICPHCGIEARVVRERREVPLGQRRVMIDDERLLCDTCGEEFYTPQQADARQRRAVEQARVEDGLLRPRDIKAIREGLNLTQREFEELLGVGEKTVVRWETGRVSQNKSTDRLIRLLAANPDNIRILAGINGIVMQLQPAAVASNATAVAPFPAMHESHQYQALSFRMNSSANDLMIRTVEEGPQGAEIRHRDDAPPFGIPYNNTIQ